MAPKKHSHPPLSVEDVRTALGHYAELAATHEGRGLEFDGQATWDSDYALLEKVTRALLMHRRNQRRRQRDAQIKLALERATESTHRFYKDESLSSYDFEQDLCERLKPLGIQPTEGELESLPDDRGLDPRARQDGDSIRERGGPAEAAKHHLADALTLSARTIALSKTREGSPLRTAFGRAISRTGLRDYLVQLGNAQVTDEFQPVTLRALATMGESTSSAMGESTGSAMDRTFDGFLRTQLTEEWYLYEVCFGDVPPPQFGEFRERFKTHVIDRQLLMTFVAMGLAGQRDETVPQWCWAYLSLLPHETKRIVLMFSRAIELDDRSCIVAMREHVEKVAEADCFEAMRDEFKQRAARFGVC
jgi:hypothetical protein